VLMALLLDMHALLWFAWGDPKLSRLARDLTEDGANHILLSDASIWQNGQERALGA
jgi:PIN domain nuclease of toxin-antitoxin system